MASSPRIDELERKFNENPRRYFAPLANEYRKAGDVERAIEICRAYLPSQPGHMSGHIVFGQALFEARQLEEARSVFETALTLDPENLIALRHLGDIAREGNDLTTARQWYGRVLDADPRSEEIAAVIAELDGAEMPHVGANDERPAAGDAVEAVSPVRPPVEVPEIPAHAATGMATDESPPPLPMPSETPFVEKSPATVDVIETDRVRGDVGSRSVVPDDAPSEHASGTGTPVTVPVTAHDPFPGLGLEPVEFVAPDRDHVPPSPGHASPATSQGPGAGGVFVTETMAELYLQQGFTTEALDLYRQLLARNPDDAGLSERVRQLERGAPSSVGAAAISEAVIESARERRSARPVRSLRSFFGSLAARRPPRPSDHHSVPAFGDERSVAPVADAGVDLAAATAPAVDVAGPREPAAAAEGRGRGEPAAGAAGGPAPGTSSSWFDRGVTQRPSPVEAANAAADASIEGGGEDDRVGAARDALSALFASDATPQDDAAATQLAGAFDAGVGRATGEPREASPVAQATGRPASRAPSEISLDNVFRDAERRSPTPVRGSGFTFEQFFAASATTASTPTPTSSSSSEAENAEASAADVEQFNAWLMGLKKK